MEHLDEDTKLASFPPKATCFTITVAAQCYWQSSLIQDTVANLVMEYLMLLSKKEKRETL